MKNGRLIDTLEILVLSPFIVQRFENRVVKTVGKYCQNCDYDQYTIIEPNGGANQVRRETKEVSLWFVFPFCNR